MSRSGSRSKLGPSAGKNQKRGKAGKSSDQGDDEGPTEIDVPQLEWQVLSEEVVQELASLEVEEVEKKIAEVLALSKHKEDLQEAALLDTYVSAYWFAAREEKFSDAQISAFITIVHTLLDNIKSKQLSLQDNVLAFREMVAGVGRIPSIEAPNPLKCFTMKVGLTTLEYLKSSLFQHHELLHYLFTEQQEEQIITQKLGVEVPPDPATLCPPPLEEAITLKLYEQCISPPPPAQDDPLDETDDVTQQTDDQSMVQIEEQAKLMNVSPEQLQGVMETVAKATLTSYKTQVAQKLKKKEEAMLNRLSKLEKALT